jgi:CBS domain-containing protein
MFQMEHVPLSTVLAGQLLVEIKDKELFKLVTLNSNDTIEAALKKLNGFKILSAPVKYQTTDQQTPTYKKLDLMDIATAITTASIHHDIFNQPIERIVREDCKMVDQTASLQDVVNLMAEGRSHRVIVTDSNQDNQLIGVISQMDIARWLTKHNENIPTEIRQMKAKEVMTPKVLSVQLHNAAISAFQQCIEHAYNGVAVVGDKGELIGNLSISDLKGLTNKNFKNLHLPVQKYISEMNVVPKTPVTCKEDELCPAVLKLMLQNHIHRVYLTDRDNRPTGLIALSNFINKLHNAGQAT